MRSRLLAHWTGKDLHAKNDRLDDDVRRSYVERLRGLTASGFWMTTPTEKLQGAGRGGGSYSFDYVTPMTCFTEVRLSHSRLHSERYGRLAIVVDRKFVLERWGGPVHYVRNHADEFVVSNLKGVRDWLSSVIDNEELNPIIPRLWENRCAVDLLFSMLKGMSRPGTDDYEYIDEHEWRIPQSQGQCDTGRLLKNEPGAIPPYFVTLMPRDVRMVVFPDAETRRIALQDAAITSWLSDAENMPPMLTIAECEDL